MLADHPVNKVLPEQGTDRFLSCLLAQAELFVLAVSAAGAQMIPHLASTCWDKYSFSFKKKQNKQTKKNHTTPHHQTGMHLNQQSELTLIQHFLLAR